MTKYIATHINERLQYAQFLFIRSLQIFQHSASVYDYLPSVEGGDLEYTAWKLLNAFRDESAAFSEELEGCEVRLK